MTAECEPKKKLEPESNNFNLADRDWAIRPCFIYKEEYDDCSSIKGRFHQYFVHGASTDCSQWKEDYKNCLLYEDSKDIKAGEALVKSESERRSSRLRAHYANDTWKKRSKPPSDWDKPLPEWLAKKNENTFLEIKAKEASGQMPESEERSYCTIM